MQEAQADIAKHKARQLAELREHRRKAWSDANIGEVRQGIGLEMRLVGSEAPQRQEITGEDGGPVELTVVEHVIRSDGETQ